MKKILVILFLLINVVSSFAQSVEQKIKDLSLQKWEWMANKDVDKLADLFHEQSKFLHMSGTWKKAEELEIIKTGSIWYKKATIHDTKVEVFKNTGIVWNRITLEANVRGADAKNEFTVTEVYVKEKKGWKLLALSFSSVRDSHQIK
jgi:hypothetical protein